MKNKKTTTLNEINQEEKNNRRRERERNELYQKLMDGTPVVTDPLDHLIADVKKQHPALVFDYFGETSTYQLSKTSYDIWRNKEVFYDGFTKCRKLVWDKHTLDHTELYHKFSITGERVNYDVFDQFIAANDLLRLTDIIAKSANFGAYPKAYQITAYYEDGTQASIGAESEHSAIVSLDAPLYLKYDPTTNAISCAKRGALDMADVKAVRVLLFGTLAMM